MASRRLIASSIRQRSWISSPQVTLSSVPLDYYKKNEQQQYPPSQLIHIRSFSGAVHDEKDSRSYRERAKEAREVASQKARDGARKGAKVARKGAKTASEMLQQYGPVFVGTYMSVYFLTWGMLFVGMDTGILDPVQIMGYIGGGGVEEGKSTVHLVVEYMEKYAWTKPYAATVEKNPHFANLAVAWVTNKFTEPVRLAVTLGIVPKLARHFGFVHVDDEHESAEHEDDAKSDENAKDETVDSTKQEEEKEAPKTDKKPTE